ncbi:pentapeptide repeat-containing protein [Micromonospora sp. NPDC005203]|uniref:pentapeptide repeat-containing protein n=1 Tax=Micromonospora sp. NPDC005203 TaxID=3364226 RepID=UPI0036CE3AB1
MSRYKRTSGDVVRWPDNPDARAALAAWLADSSAYLPGDSLDFRGADLSCLDLPGACLANSQLVGVRFEEANLGAANLANAEARGADFSAADLAKADLVGCVAGAARFRSARLFAVQLDDAVLNGADLGHAILNSAPVFVHEGATRSPGGGDLEVWLSAQGAESVSGGGLTPRRLRAGPREGRPCRWCSSGERRIRDSNS